MKNDLQIEEKTLNSRHVRKWCRRWQRWRPWQNLPRWKIQVSTPIYTRAKSGWLLFLHCKTINLWWNFHSSQMFFNLSAVASPLSPLGTYMNMCLPKLVKSSTLFSRHIFLYKTLSPKMLIYVLQIYQATNSSPTFSPCKGTRENNFTGGCKQSCVPSLKSYLEMYISAYFH